MIWNQSDWPIKKNDGEKVFLDEDEFVIKDEEI